MYHWQAKPDDEASCTANAVFEQGRGSPRHPEVTHTGAKTTHATRQTPGGSDICLEDAAEVSVWV